MFESLTQRLTRTLDSIRGQGRLTEDQINTAARELRMALLEADVALPVIKSFIDKLKARALGAEITQSLTPGQAFLRVVQHELTEALGGTSEPLNLRAQPPVVILMAGLQGSGKTTTTAKLARRLKEDDKKSVVVVSCDVYRPAAIEQLRIVATGVGVDVFPSAVGQDPIQIAKDALAYARKQFADVLIVDTAGRTTVDQEMMAEIAALHAAVQPTETLFVVDSMTGQDAANTAKAFADVLPLTGVVLTKVDGDSRGGAALSVRTVTGRPIKFLGVGEKTDKLEVFHPDRIANRIIGQGDVLTLIEETTKKVDAEQAQKLAKKLTSKKGFDLADFREQMQQMQSMGSLESILEKLPGGAQMQAQLKNVNAEKEIRRTVAIINSMTPQERKFPDLIKASRKRRIATGSGVEVQEVNKMLRQFETSRDLMKKMAGGGMAKMLRRLGGKLPPGMMPPR
ncbi:signal recognition particle subunit FFH/SRP54 (srp54) [Panacagrimonas perspica]|uniref:Signal recognition particle protein n=1 Tax=Panacagrimonas perspica TaxID=381431 RepID=A0A4R7PB27_9GAMM|nr:signal recognition particle protein [Panacagrimonas perspica]TDU31158.1 signal recognition particle subunit FFH/SRP54 (srp54) [Panacagrimonas perspica]THD01715.1 signal recognition particle protein [Panacagrimonas perspica]